eukprot:scaffold205851_cov21-Tisochrysis_lutea.AAC.1
MTLSASTTIRDIQLVHKFMSAMQMPHEPIQIISMSFYQHRDVMLPIVSTQQLNLNRLMFSVVGQVQNLSHLPQKILHKR